MNIEEFFEKFFSKAYYYFKGRKVFPEKTIMTLSIESVEELYIKIYISNTNVKDEFRYLSGICKIKFNKYVQEKVEQREFLCENNPEILVKNFPDESGNNPEEKYLKYQAVDEIWKSINELKNPEKYIIIMKYFNEKKSKEIAKKLSLTDENVRKILERGRNQLRKKLLIKDIKWI